jgi:hypothetical protein
MTSVAIANLNVDRATFTDTIRYLTTDELKCVAGGISGIGFVNIGLALPFPVPMPPVPVRP